MVGTKWQKKTLATPSFPFDNWRWVFWEQVLLGRAILCWDEATGSGRIQPQWFQWSWRCCSHREGRAAHMVPQVHCLDCCLGAWHRDKKVCFLSILVLPLNISLLYIRTWIFNWNKMKVLYTKLSMMCIF